MLRFLPDDLLEALLRPLVLADAQAGIYFERAAPDFRLALFLVFMAAACLWRRALPCWTGRQKAVVLGLFASLYLWTFVSGNGRYFLFGLLLSGPLVVLGARCLPGTRAFRAALLLVAIGVQVFVVQSAYAPNDWGLVRWRQGPGLQMAASPLRKAPAIFLTVTSISHSALVPLFHPASRWANVVGQTEIIRGTRDDGRFMELLGAGLPLYVLLPAQHGLADAAGQPDAMLRGWLASMLGRHALALADGMCERLASPLAVMGQDGEPDLDPQRGYWVCPLKRTPLALPASANDAPPEITDAFSRIEMLCPRFFPPGGGQTKPLADGMLLRHYPSTDVRLFATANGHIFYKYFRAPNPTLIGTASELRDGRVALDCHKLPGRYQLPWNRS